MGEITVRGAGIIGLSIAWACARRGANVQVIDPFGAGAGSSGGVVGALAPHIPENWNDKKAFQLESLLMAETFWREVQQTGGLSPGYGQTGRLQPVQDQRLLDLARQRAETAKCLWKDHAEWRVERAAGSDWEPTSPTGWLIRDTLSARLHPRQACDALVASLQTLGIGILREGQDKGRVLWATGVNGLEALNRTHHRLVGSGVKGQAALLRYDAADAPQLFCDGLHIVPHTDGTVAIGSTSEREYDDPTSTDAQLDTIIDKARTALPCLQDAPVINRWAGIRPRARSRAPMLGAWPGKLDHFIANGGFKIGFGMAPKIAEVMADLLLEDHDAIPEDFRVEASL